MTEHADEHSAIDEIRLPPSFVADHCIRTLAYQGAMSVIDIAKHWRVPDAVAADAVESLKTAGLVRPDAGPTDFDRLGRVRLSDTGQARVATARERTWYAGPLPVALTHLGRLATQAACGCSRDVLRAGLAAIQVDETAADVIGQAVTSGGAVAIAGAARDEQGAIASAIGGALQGQAELPYAIFAAGAVLRVFDPQHHRAIEAQRAGGEVADILRSPTEKRSQWTVVRPPMVTLAGGVLPTDIVPAYDDEAKFYVAPPACAAWGGVLCVMDSASNPAALAELARMWLLPGRQGAGILRLRSGERIEVPWRSATVLLSATPEVLPAAVRDAVTYFIDISELGGAALAAFVERRLSGADAHPERVSAALAAMLEEGNLATRAAAARATQFLRDRASYEGAGFSLSMPVLTQAVDFARDGDARGHDVQRAA
jgi:DNA-binding MarR family transcriptional regulator